MLKRYALALMLGALLNSTANASHIMGSHISYKWLGGMDYEVTLILIRDCFGIPLQVTEVVEVTSSCGSVTLPMDVRDTVEVASCSGMISQCQGGAYPGAELHFYRDTVALTGPCADWTFKWVNCCRNAAITNLIDPSNYGMQLWATLDNLNQPGNSSPIWQELPGIAICSNVPFCLPNGGFDIDGDSLVYSQVDPIDDGGSPMVFTLGFNAADPYPSSNGHAFDAVTGNHCTTPSTMGQYAMAYRLDEYRGGVMIGSSQREVQLWVINCPIAEMDIQGTVYDPSATPVNSGEVQLFQYGLNSAGSVQVNSATLGVGGTYSFPNQPVGQYLVRCISDTANYPGTADSYHESTYYWTYADVVASQCDTTVVADVTLVTTGNLNGPGVVSGFLGDLGIVRTQLGAPWAGVGIIAETWPMTSLVAFTRTDGDGLWSISGLPNGTYRVIADHPGLPMMGHYIVTIGGGQNVYENLDYTGNPEGIWPSSELLGVEAGAQPTEGLLVFPNPSQGDAVQLTGLSQANDVLELVSVEGKVVRRVPTKGTVATVPTSGLPAGIYTVRSLNDLGLNARIVLR